MHQFDASSIVFAWDTYPEDQFPKLWDWLEANFASGEFTICYTALQEVDHVAPDCRQWLREKGVSPTPIDGTILSEAMNSKNLLGIVEQQFHPRGVDENDLIIISSATILGATLITNEARQLDLPDNPAKYKIPAVCDLIGLPWTDFTRLLRNNGGTFG